MKFVSLISVTFVLFLGAHTAPSPQGSCDQGVNCHLPDCLCVNKGGPGTDHTPGGLDPQKIPQIVMFSFDDAVNVLNYPFYQRLFPFSRKNPNGCPATMTVFVSDDYTDYSMVRNLFLNGNEIASHSVSHRTPVEYWKTINRTDMEWEAEESRRRMSEKAGIPIGNITGWRAPYHQPSEVMMEVLQEKGYHYDSSLLATLTTGHTRQQWPFTLDHGYPLTCVTPPCPKDTHAGFWEVNVVPISDRQNIFPCAYIDGCYYQPQNFDETMEILMNNFNVNYQGNRAPFYINMHAWWFGQAEYKLDAMDDFISQILALGDVYIVTFQQGIEWARNPTELDDIEHFGPWKCP